MVRGKKKVENHWFKSKFKFVGYLDKVLVIYLQMNFILESKCPVLFKADKSISGWCFSFLLFFEVELTHIYIVQVNN